MERFHTVYRDEGLHCATWGPLFVQRWLADASGEQVETMLELHTAFVEARPLGTTLSVSHVEVTHGRPDERSRAAMRRHMKLAERAIGAAATVISCEGFASAMVRSVLSGLVLVTRPKCPHGVFSTTAEGFGFVLEHRPVAGVDARSIEEAYRREVVQR
ncbi:MAG: hypothetical protein KF729_14705 [Sandaracinaceae bacterium]|nr:hypothetical protein [Sandaracinaceae bacterium]